MEGFVLVQEDADQYFEDHANEYCFKHEDHRILQRGQEDLISKDITIICMPMFL